MKVVGLYFTLALFFFLPSSASAISAQENSKDLQKKATSQDLLYSDRFFYTSTRRIQPITSITDDVTVITREEIDRWPVSDLDQALGYVNGIVVQDVGHIGQTATAQINGSKPREVLVMVDGIPMNATTTGGIADLSLIPLDFVEKIEVIKGASSSVWGSAMGGVINIITRPVGKKRVPHGSATMSFGEYNTQRQRGEIWGAAGPLHYYTFGGRAESGGFRPNSDEHEGKSFTKLAVPLTENLALKGSFGYSGSKISEFELPDVNQTQKRKAYSRYGNAGLSHTWNERLDSDLFYKIAERSFRREIRLYPSQAFFQFSKATSIVHQVSLQNNLKIAENQNLSFGSDITVDVYRDAVFRATTTRANVNKEATEHAYYANYQLSWRALDTSLGTRLDATNSYGVNFDPSAGAVLHLPFWKSLFRFNVARAFNAPSLVDRYLTVATTVANPDLKAEHAIVYNLGPELEPIDRVRLKASFFQSFLRDSIQTITRSDGLRQPVNIARERRTGFSTETTLGPWYGFSPSYGTTFVYAFQPGMGPIQSRPRFTQDIKLNYERLIASVNSNWNLTGRHMDLVQYTGSTAPNDQVFIFDGKITLTFPSFVYGNLSVFLIGKNLFNQDFSFDQVRYPNPKRNFEFGTKYAF
jgi:vitamin B12 transporter